MQALFGWLQQRALCNECLCREAAVCRGCRVATCDNCLANCNCCTWARCHEECLHVDDQIPRWTLERSQQEAVIRRESRAAPRVGLRSHSFLGEDPRYRTVSSGPGVPRLPVTLCGCCGRENCDAPMPPRPSTVMSSLNTCNLCHRRPCCDDCLHLDRVERACCWCYRRVSQVLAAARRGEPPPSRDRTDPHDRWVRRHLSIGMDRDSRRQSGRSRSGGRRGGSRSSGSVNV